MNDKDDKINLQSSQDLKKPVRQRDPRKGRMLLIALAGVVLLAAAAVGVTQLAKAIQSYVEVNTDHTIHLTETTEDQVQRIEIAGRNEMTITRRGDAYAVSGLAPALTSQAACQSAFANAATLLAEGVAAEGVTDFAEYGLTDPVSTVTITYADRTLRLEIGGVAPASQHYYVRVDGGDTVYLMRPLIVEMYSKGIAAYRDLSGFAVRTQGLSGCTLRTGETVLELRRHDRTGGSAFTPWQIVQPERANTDPALADSFVAQLQGIQLDSYVRTAQDQSEFGLDAPWRTLELRYADGSAFTMALGGDAGLGNLYASFDGGADVYIVKGESVAFLDGASLPGLVNEFANIVALNSVDRLTVTLDGASAAFAIDRTGDEPVYTRDGAPIDAEAFKEAFQAVNVVPVNGFASAEEAQGAQPALTLVYEFNNGEAPYTVTYLDASINNYVLDKNGSVSVTAAKDDCAAMLELWRALLA